MRIKRNLSKPFSDRADRSWIGVNRLLNGLGYVLSLTCGVLGLTAHSMRAMRRGVNAMSQKAYSGNVFTIGDTEKQAYDQTARGSKEWFARAGVLGLMGLGIGGVIIGVTKGIELAGRLLGISSYSGQTIARAFKRCANFVFGTNYDIQPNQKYIDDHKARNPQTLADRTSRSWIGLNRVLNGFSYAISFACGLLGLTAQHARSTSWYELL